MRPWKSTRIRTASTRTSTPTRITDIIAATPRGESERRLRLGVMGGTFDPIHHGHLVAASEVAAKFGLDEVVFVPTGQPWQKSHKLVSKPEHRYLMTVIATASNPRFTVSRVDVDRPGPTFTIDTLRDLRAERPDADLFFITGADALAQILSWKDVDELWSLAHFVGVTRPGHELHDMGRDDVSLLEVPAMAISSTDCRTRVGAGNPVWYLVPDGVVQYIAKYGLYAARPEPGELSPVLSGSDDQARTE
ncbi:nicotinate-nucleotide adenylyltransferase [Paenarthrobacter sp. NPDC056912]|uniref:nicotinate-nucleotide adenylyltransferase n=1 Tax=Paenarthrobacter sp. NPDC056912 TaxID=3345965 RepID=UPI00366E9F36